MSLPLCAFAFVFFSTVAHASPHVVSWVSEPVLPGETALALVVGSVALANNSVVEVRSATAVNSDWQVVEAEGFTAAGCAFTLPDTFTPGAFDVRIDGGAPYRANQPRPWFVFADQGRSGTPGGWARVIGEAITLARDKNGTEPLPLLRLVPKSDAAAATDPIVLTARRDGPSDAAIGMPRGKLSRWHALFELPLTLAPGVYEIAAAHGRSDGTGTPDAAFAPLCTFVDEHQPCLATLTITPPASALADPRRQFDQEAVFVVNATQPGAGRDATVAVQRAIAKAAAYCNHPSASSSAQSRGAIVYFPRGQYFIRGALLVAPGTVLRGAGRGLVSIYFAEDNSTSAPPAYVTSTAPGAWGLEDLTLYVTAFANDIVRFSPGTSGAFMRRCTVRFNSYFCLEAKRGASSRGRTTNWEHDVGCAVKLAGSNLFVTDNDIYSSGDVVSTRDNGAAGAEYMHIARNRFWNGGTTHWGISWKQSIYEDNVATGVSTTAMGSNYPQYAHNDGAPHVQHILHSNNTQTQVWGNDREMMTCDGGGGVYYGAATSKPNSSLVTLPSAASAPQPGGAICVLAGTGTAECRRALGNAAPPPGPTPMKAGAPLSVTAIGPGVTATALALRPPTDANNGSIVVDAKSSLAIVTLCDPPGHSASSNACGANDFDEPLVLGTPDAWTSQYGTAKFRYNAANQTLWLAKSGKCVGLAVNSTLALVSCDGTGARKWVYNTGAKQFCEAGIQPGICIGMAAKSSGAVDLTQWMIDRPFTVPLDNSSRITIMPYIGRIAFNGNDYSDGGEVQFYAQALGVVAAENKFTRTGGLSAWARGYSGKDANLRNSFIDNVVVEGNHVWNYNTSPGPAEDPSVYPYFPGGSKTVEPWFFASLTNEQGPPIDPSPPGEFEGAFNRFITFRGNIVDSNGGIVVRGTSANVLVEGSVIRQSDVGVHVNKTTTQGGIVLRRNVEPAGVPPNYNPYSQH